MGFSFFVQKSNTLEPAFLHLFFEKNHAARAFSIFPHVVGTFKIEFPRAFSRPFSRPHALSPSALPLELVQSRETVSHTLSNLCGQKETQQQGYRHIQPRLGQQWSKQGIQQQTTHAQAREE